jgi:hypothetical protein
MGEAIKVISRKNVKDHAPGRPYPAPLANP